MKTTNNEADWIAKHERKKGAGPNKIEVDVSLKQPASDKFNCNKISLKIHSFFSI